MRHWIVAVRAGTALIASIPFSTTAFAEAVGGPGFTAAVAAPERSAEHTALDASRKPEEVLAFLGLKMDDTAADVMAGTGYYSVIMARAVGPKGRVLVFQPQHFFEGDAAKVWDALKTREANITVVPYAFNAFETEAAALDFTMLHLVYHDLYWESAEHKVPRTDPAVFVAALFAATRPGGIVGVVDHVAEPGDTRTTVDKLHRIDPAVIRADFKAAGFVLEAESDLLRVPADDHSKLVFDPAVRGKTDRVLYRFRKPA